MTKISAKITLFFQDSWPLVLNLFIALCAFAAPLKVSLLSVLSLTFLDNVTAMWLAVKRGQTIESSKLRRTVNKLSIYLIAIISGYICETSILGQQQTVGLISKSIIFLISVAELKSILENVSALSTLDGQSINFWQALLSTLQAKGGNLNASQFSQFGGASQTQTSTTVNTQTQSPEQNTSTLQSTQTIQNSSHTQTNTQVNTQTDTNVTSSPDSEKSTNTQTRTNTQVNTQQTRNPV